MADAFVNRFHFQDIWLNFALDLPHNSSYLDPVKLLTYGHHACAISGHKIWNSLPDYSIDIFIHCLKITTDPY